MAGIWDLAPAAGQDVWALAPAVGGTVPHPAHAQDIGDAILAGLKGSATGLAIRGKLPEQQIGEDAPWYHRIASGAAGMVADLPLSVVGAVGGAAAGTAVAPGPGTLVGGGAGAFAAPMALRDALIEAYSHNYASSWEGVWEIAKAAMKGGGKGAIIGGATMGAGRVVAPLVTRAGGGAAATAAASLGAELTTLTTTSAALEGKLPTAQDFMDNAILLGGMKAAVHTAQGLRNIYAETGKTPEQVVADAQKDPALKAALTGEPDIRNINVYHGTTSKFDTAEFHGGDFTSNRARAENYAQGGQGRVLEATLDIRKPMPWSEAFGKTPAEIKAAGFDGTIQWGANGEVLRARVVDPAQIKPPHTSMLDIPPSYRGEALEQRVQAAIGVDPRPELVRRVVSGEKDWLPPETQPAVAWEYVTDRESAQGVLRAITERYGPEIEAQRRGEVSNAESLRDAKALLRAGETAEHVAGTAENSSQILVRAALLRDALNHTYAELKKIAATPEADLTPTMKLRALAAVERAAMLNAEFAGARAEAGRALQIFRSLKRDPSMLGEAEALVKLYERKGSLQDIARFVEGLKDPAQLAEFAREYQRATTIEKVQEGWKAAILSGPQTHLANVFGNLTKYAVEVPENVISATLTAINKAAKGDPLTLAQWKARAFAGFYGIQHGAKDALHVAAEVWRGQGQHLEKADVYRVAIEGKKGEYIRTPFKALQVEDALFRTVAERAKAYEMAVDRVVKEGLHPDTMEARDRITLYAQRPEIGLTEKQAAGVLAEIQNAGAEAVFAQRLGPKMEMLQRATQGSLLGFIVPFVRTPTNLVSWAIQHVPGLNLLSGRWRNDFMAGGEARSKAVARVVIGAGLTITAYQMAADGLITGGGLFDKEEGGTKRAAGWQAYSVKIGDTYYSYQRIEPVAKVIGLAADLIELQKATKDEEDKAKIAAMLVLLFGNATVSTTYLSGVSNSIQAVTDPNRFGENFLEQYATSLVPKIIGQTVTMADPHKREVDGVMDAIQSQLPFLREKLMPKRDVWGEPVENGRWFGVMPVATSQISEDKVKTEAVRLELAIQDAPKFIMEKGPFNPKDKRLELTQEQRDIHREVAGKFSMEILKPIVNAPDWERIPDFAKAAIYKGVLEAGRRQGAQAALPADSAAREALRQKIVDRIIRETQAVENK